ncbi:hypothetical protein ABZ667_42920, partial [Streptomyces lavendulae]|uniref:hypothetical protein n=1 Tax=Streptomyces lavendulae TaxID=1914 RepID=UPI0033C97D5F
RTGNLGEKYKKTFLAAALINLTASASGVGSEWDLEKGKEWDLAAKIGSTAAVSMPVMEQFLTLAGKARAAEIVGGKISPVVSAIANFASLINNVFYQDKIDPLAVTFDVMGLAADALGIAAIGYSAVAPIAGTAGFALAVPSMVYIIINWGGSLPMPGEFMTEFGAKAIASIHRSLNDFRADHFQMQEAGGKSEEDIMRDWKKVREASYNTIRSHLQLPDVGSGKVSIAAAASVMDAVQMEIAANKGKGIPRFPAVVTSEYLRSLYVELGRYCIDKIKRTQLGDLDKLEFSLLEWLESPAAKAWLTKTVRDEESIPPKD